MKAENEARNTPVVRPATDPPEDLRNRTKRFALRVIRLVSSLPRTTTSDVIGRQLLKAGTSIGANYREAQRASSKRHFITTMEIVQRETDETSYWLELLIESDTVARDRLDDLRNEAEQLLSIVTTIVRRAKDRSE